ncbi:MAG: SAM-dependent methyltransferase [Pseudomonadota bacterium]
MAAAPQLVDRAALTLHRRRARSDMLFLHREAAASSMERLKEVNRSFTRPAIVGPFPEVWDEIGAAKHVPDTDILDLSPASHDLVLHGLCLHWANDPVGQLVQARRALQPDGLLIATLFGGRTLSELGRVLTEAEAEVSGGLSPRILPMGDIRDLGGLLARAGLALPVADVTTHRVSYSDTFHLMRDLRLMGETNALTDRLRRPTSRRLFTRAAELYQAGYGDKDGRISATFDIVTLTGWAPAASQQQPLRPGSAKVHLSDALKDASDGAD